jgi:predicted lipid carrier protein YhbT
MMPRGSMKIETTLQHLRKKIQHKLVTKTPKLLSLPCQFVPFVIQKACLTKVINHVFKEAIEEGDLSFLENKWLKVTIIDFNLTWFLSFDNKLIIQNTAPKTDVSFSAVANDLILIAGRKEDPDTLFFQRRLQIEGDTELGLEVKNLLDNIEFDKLSPAVEKIVLHFSDFVAVGLKPIDNEVSNKSELIS